MPRPSPRQLAALRKRLCEAFLGLRSPEDCDRFLTDLCTPGEVIVMSERLWVAALIAQGLPYRKINEKTGVSTATVTRVARSLAQGPGGYRLLLERSKEKSR